MSRPELTGHAAHFYNAKEARKYDSSSRMMSIQHEITVRAIELLRLSHDTPSFVLDVGCGSGLSGQVLEQAGHVWVGCDVSRDMLGMAKERMERQREAQNAMKEDEDDEDEEEEESNALSTGDLCHHDMGTGLPFRPGTFDACISISALQWLCYSNAKNQNPRTRLIRFFSSLYSVLKRGGRAVLQFYPETAEQAVLIAECATRVGFAGGVVVDYPNSAKAKKHYLVLSFDRGAKQRAEEQVKEEQRQGIQVLGNAPRTGKAKPIRKKKGKKTKEWILHKKETQRKKKGADKVRPDTKYTGRRRPTKF